MKPKTSALLLAQALVAVAVLAAAGGLRLSVIAALAAAGVLLTRRRASRTVAAGVLTAAAIVVIATGQAKSQPLRAHGTPIARPATSASDLELITEPQAGNAPFLALIAGARHTVTLTMYELEDPSIEHALAAEAGRGVNVRVRLNGGYYSERVSTNQLAYNYLADHHVHVRYTPSYFPLTHQKTLTIDGHIAVVMTLNFDGAYSTTRDYAIIDRQTADVRANLATFDPDYEGRPIQPSAGVGDLVWSPGAADAFLSLVDSARQSIDLENEEMDYTLATDALCADARRDVAIRIVMTYQSKWASAFSKLSGCGASIRLYHGQRYYIHAKLLLVDAREALVGSQNLSTTSLDGNRELSIELRRHAIAESGSPLRRGTRSDWPSFQASQGPPLPQSSSAQNLCDGSDRPSRGLRASGRPRTTLREYVSQFGPRPRSQTGERGIHSEVMQMQRTMLKSKIHRATVTDSDLHYVGSITIDPNLLDAADILEHELVAVVDVDNGARFETYTIAGQRGSGEIKLNGAAARLAHRGDTIIIISYGAYDETISLRIRRELCTSTRTTRS